MKMNQVIAIANGEKSKAQKTITKIYQNLKKESLFDGISRRYTPKFEDGDVYPNEDKRVQLTVSSILLDVKDAMSDMLNIISTQDIGNCDAKANIVIDNNIIAEDVPVTHLLFLEKQMIDLKTLVSALPVLDPAEKWGNSQEMNVYKTETKENFKTKKVPKNHVLAEATDTHPAQVQVFTEDIVEGTWETIKFSGNIIQSDKDILLDKIEKMIKAIIFAREEANGMEVEKSNIGSTILEYIFNGL